VSEALENFEKRLVLEQTKEAEFLRGLRELTLRTGISIGGCGCCSSPYLSHLKPEEITETSGYTHNGEVAWLSPADSLRWDQYAKVIVR
jgi:hypothetical protein